MKKGIFNKICAIAASAVMTIGLAACGSSGTSASSTAASAATSASAASGTVSTAASSATSAADNSGNPVNLTMAFLVFGSTPNDLQKVNDAVNEYLMKKLNCTVTLTPINASNYSQEIDLMLTSGESLDLLADGTITAFFNYTSHAAKGQLYSMNDLIDKYGSGIKDALGDYWDAAAVNGDVYGVASVRDLAADTALIMKSSALKAAGYDPENISISSYADLETLLQKVKDAESGVAPIMIGSDAAGTIYDSLGLSFDTQGDQLSDLIGVLMDNQDPTVSDYYESDKCKALTQRVYDWYKKGYILQDAATNQSSATDLMKAGKITGYIGNSKPGNDTQVGATIGEDVTAVSLSPVLSDTQKVTGFMWAIAAQSKNPEKAMQVLNLMYTDSTFINLLDHGIENEHYVYSDKENNIIDFPEGVTSDTDGYYLNADFEFGNQLLSSIWKGNDPDIWTKLDEFNKSAIVSKAMGFQFDSTNVKTEYAAVTSVIDQYKQSLGQGTVDPSVLDEFVSKLKSAGIDTIVQEKQKQLDTFLAGSSGDTSSK